MECRSFFRQVAIEVKEVFKSRSGVECGEVSRVSPLFPTEKAWEGVPR